MNSKNLWSSVELQAKRQQYVAPAVFQLTDRAIVKAKGAKVWDVEGNEYIDFVGGIGCVNAGHNPDEVVQAIKEQVDQYIHPSINILNYQPYVEVVQTLCQITPGSNEKKAVLFNSGAEAVENAIKIARYVSRRSAVICFDGAFHGRTMLAMSLTSKIKPYKFGYGPYMPEVYHVPHPQIDNISNYDEYWQKIFSTIVEPSSIAAIIFEPVLGEGGFYPMPKAFVKHLRELCSKHQIIMIADEVQSGFSRTGKLFAMEHFEVEADLMTLGKSIASGMPLTAVVGQKALVDASHIGGLGGTFCGNPLACVSSLATIELYKKQNLSQRAIDIGKQVRAFFSAIKNQYHCINGIHGLGAMIGIEFVNEQGQPDAALLKSIMTKSLDNGVILMSSGLHGNILRTLMPLIITDSELSQAFRAIERAVQDYFKDG